MQFIMFIMFLVSLYLFFVITNFYNRVITNFYNWVITNFYRVITNFYNRVIKYISSETFLNFLVYLIVTVTYITISCMFSQPVYAESLTDLLENGTINRIPLVQAGQTFHSLPHGLYQVTGGYVNIGFLGKGHVTKVIGILVNNYPTTIQ